MQAACHETIIDAITFPEKFSISSSFIFQQMWVEENTNQQNSHIGKLIGLWWEGGHVCNHTSSTATYNY